jgi:hypothetical protein
MTVSALITRNDITATASQTSFTYTFRVLAATDMDVYQNGVLLSSGYTVNNVGTTTGGTVVLDAGVPVGQIVSLVLAMPLDRTTDYQNSGKFLADDVNGDFDKSYIGAIQNENAISRSLRLKDVEPTIDMTLPLKNARKGAVLGFDENTGLPVAGPNIADVSSVAAITADITTVAGVSSEVSAVAAISANVATVAGNTDNINTVASNDANITAVAGNASDISTVANNIVDVTNFADVYQGGKASNPTVRNDGSELQAGDLYFNTSVNKLRVYSGSAWNASGVGSTSSDLVSYTPSGTGAVATTVQAKLRESVSVKDFGATGDGVTDDAVAIQSAITYAETLGMKIVFPQTSQSYAVGKSLVISKSDIILEGLGGRVDIKYIGSVTGASTTGEALGITRTDAAVFIIHKDNNAGSNFQHVVIKNFRIDGGNKALFGFNLYGFTRRCRLENIQVYGCVCSVYARDCFYSSYIRSEFGQEPNAIPVGMVLGVYTAFQYTMYMSVCHAVLLEQIVFFAAGRSIHASYPYTAIFSAVDCNGLSLDTCTFEANETYYVKDVISLGGSATCEMSNCYLELLECVDNIIRVNTGTNFVSTNNYFNGVKSSLGNLILSSGQSANIVLNNTFAENLDLGGKVISASPDSQITGTTLIGTNSFISGSSTGGIYLGENTTYSKEGLLCDPIKNNINNSSTFLGHVSDGYTLSIIDTTKIKISQGHAVINGNGVGFLSNESTYQSLLPDVSVTDTWYVRLTGLGSPFLERLSAPKVGSAYSPIIGTFTTNGTAINTGPTAVAFNTERQLSVIEKPVTTELINRETAGYALLLDTGTAATTDLINVSLSSGVGEDDFFGIQIDYILATTSGATLSTESGSVFVAIAQDNAYNRVSTIVKATPAQALDAGMSSMTVTFATTTASNVVTINCKNETSANANSGLYFTAKLRGAKRSGTSAVLASGVVVGV